MPNCGLQKCADIEKMQCVVHYYFTNTDYSELKALTHNQYERSVEAKEIRLAATFENQHLEQCNSLPIDGFDTARHGVHLNPCYKKFTKIISVERSKESREGEPRPKSMKADEAGSSHGFFPKICIFCNQYRKTVRRKLHSAYKILTKEAEQNIRCAANVNNDLPLLCQIQDVDLIAKELMIHKKLYLYFGFIS